MDKVKEGYVVCVYEPKTYELDHIVFFFDKLQAVSHVDDYIIDGFCVRCEETRILVPDMLDGESIAKSVDINSDCNHRDNLENNEVEDGLLSSDDR